MAAFLLDPIWGPCTVFIVHRFLNTSRGPKILFLPANIAVASRVHAVINISIIHVQLPQLCTRSKTVSSCCVLKKANVKDVRRKWFFLEREKIRKLAFQRLWDSSCRSYVEDLAFVEKSRIGSRQSLYYRMSLAACNFHSLQHHFEMAVVMLNCCHTCCHWLAMWCV